jgi:hypothetical protein
MIPLKAFNHDVNPHSNAQLEWDFVSESPELNPVRTPWLNPARTPIARSLSVRARATPAAARPSGPAPGTTPTIPSRPGRGRAGPGCFRGGAGPIRRMGWAGATARGGTIEGWISTRRWVRGPIASSTSPLMSPPDASARGLVDDHCESAARLCRTAAAATPGWGATRPAVQPPYLVRTELGTLARGEGSG